MATIKRFEQIEAWQVARKLVNRIYALSNREPFAKDFGLRDQMRRAGVSVMANIAEGFETRTTADFIKYLGVAKASAGEVRSHAYVAFDQGYIIEKEFNEIRCLAEICSRKIRRFMNYLKRRYPRSEVRSPSSYYSSKPSS